MKVVMASRERALQKEGGRSRPFGGGKKTPKWASRAYVMQTGEKKTRTLRRIPKRRRPARRGGRAHRSVGIELDVEVVVRRLGEGFEQHVVVLADDLRDFRRERLALGDRDVVGAEVERPVLEVQ